jgi:Chaperone of endosialidase
MNSMNQSPIRVSLIVGLALACFVVLPNAPAVSPPPDGGYPGGNTAEGENALFSLTSGTYNTAVGLGALGTVTEGKLNTAIGAGTLLFNTADGNTAVGAGALYSNTTGRFNTATGEEALANNTLGIENTANGLAALFSNTTGSVNTATGFFALTNNTDGSGNTANGTNALAFNITGSENTATGSGALFNNNASGNTANGASALFANTTGTDNTAMGKNALSTNISGRLNTAIGSGALSLSTGAANTAVGDSALRLSIGDHNTAVGEGALASNTTGSNNTALGLRAGSNLTTGDNNIDIGADGMAGESNTIRIGNGGITNTFIRGISGATAAGGAAVFVASNGHLGTTTSSARFKDEIKPMGNSSEAILALRPVSFRYKKDIDPQGIPEFGLVAEEVEKVNPALVIRDPEGRPYTVRYEQVNAMLLNEFLKEHKTVQGQGATIAELKKEIAALAAGLQKVSAQLEAGKPAPRVVNNP